MTALPECDYLRLIKAPEVPLSKAEVAQPLVLDDLIDAADFGSPAPVYPIAVWRRAFGR